MRYKNLVFLGTSHIARQSLNEVKKYIEGEEPDIIALELDKKRMCALISKHQKIRLRNVKQIGLKGFLFSLFAAWAERKLGKLVGVTPGSEMKHAIKLAKKGKIEIALVDQDIEITLQRLSQSITWKEKKNFLVDVFKSLFLNKEEIEFDLSTVPDREIIRKLTNRVKERYPNVYKVLIEERNKFIAEKIKKLMSATNKKILVILGAGHIDDVFELVKKEEALKISYSFSIR